jgi:serine/threonine protein kinase
MIGQTISHYKILDKLGEGGMGVVYKALDTRLDRTVALKFLPHHIRPDEAEQARFLQEAKAASALNHPNVCTIYGIHDADGQKFIEMEFVEGVTLRHKLPVQSLAEAITYAVQIGDALYEAHQKGIVHRDIKADNIMINTKNQVKVMDFGLAKLKGSLKLTKTTSTVGTLAYMAPEQIQGGEVDARSDIFSYGVVLYELLTGRLPFRSEHEAALMYSIIHDEPDPIERHRADLSPVFINLIQRALEKDPKDRFQSINEMVIELRRLQKQSAKVSRASLSSMPAQSLPAEHTQISSSAMPAAAKPKKTLRIAAAGVAVVLVGAAVWMFLLKPPSRLELNPQMSFRALRIPFQETGNPSLSRDGSWIAFAALGDRKTWDVYLMNASSGESRKITNDSSASIWIVSLSPDGGQIAYDRADKGNTKHEIALVSSLGGFSKRVVAIGYRPKWRPDGQRIAYIVDSPWGSTTGKTEIRSIKPGGADDRLELSDSLGVIDFAWSPDGKSICFSQSTGWERSEIFTRNLESGKTRQLTSLNKNTSSVTWTEKDEIVFASNLNGNYNLWMIPSSGGTPVQITRGSGEDLYPTVSADLKRLVYLQQQSISHVWVASLQQGVARQLTFDDDATGDPVFSPDGRRVLYAMWSQNPSEAVITSVFVIESDGSAKRQLMSEEARIHSLIWSPDGKSVVFAMHPDSIPHDSARTFVVDADNPGSPRQIGVGFPITWVRDRSFLTRFGTGTWICTLEGAPPTRYFRDSTLAEPVLNGEYVLYSGLPQTRKPGLWIERAPGSSTPRSEPKELATSAAHYSYDAVSKSVYYMNPQNELHRVSLPDGNDEKVQESFPGFGSQSKFNLSPDGMRIIYLDTRSVCKLMLIENFH